MEEIANLQSNPIQWRPCALYHGFPAKNVLLICARPTTSVYCCATGLLIKETLKEIHCVQCRPKRTLTCGFPAYNSQ